MRARVGVVALAVGLASPLSAQMPVPDADPSGVALKLTDSVQPLYRIIKGYLLSSAEQVPESDYAFRPTPEVRSFGELIGHVANAQYMFCSMAKGEENPSQEDFEERTGKAELIVALEASTDYCDAVFAGMGDDAAVETVEVFGNDMSRLGVLAFNVAHDFEHYGNIVTYMRLRGMVPPSSQ